MPLAGVVFDFDGVIADTENLHLRAYQDVLVDTALSLSEASYFGRYLGYDDVGVFTALAEDSGIVLNDGQVRQLVADKGRRFDALLGSDDVLFPGSADCVRRLAGATTLGIASGALHQEIERILMGASLREYFTVIVAADDVAHPKPAPDSYVAAVAALGASTGTSSAACYVAVEDSPWGLESAYAAGLKSVAVTNSYPEARLSNADIVIKNLDSLDLPLLQRLCI